MVVKTERLSDDLKSGHMRNDRIVPFTENPRVLLHLYTIQESKIYCKDGEVPKIREIKSRVL